MAQTSGITADTSPVFTPLPISGAGNRSDSASPTGSGPPATRLVTAGQSGKAVRPREPGRTTDCAPRRPSTPQTHGGATAAAHKYCNWPPDRSRRAVQRHGADSVPRMASRCGVITGGPPWAPFRFSRLGPPENGRNKRHTPCKHAVHPAHPSPNTHSHATRPLAGRKMPAHFPHDPLFDRR